MPLAPIQNLSAAGIVTDVNPMELPDNGFNYGENVRFATRAIEKIQGHEQVFGTVEATPYWLLPVETYTTAFWLYAGLTEVWVTDGTTHSNITRIAADKSVTSITNVTTTATATVTAHGYSNGDRISISGANEAPYNGTFTISNVTANTFDYTMSSDPGGSATGTIIANKNTLYAADADKIWNGGIISGLPVINNGIDDPQMWSPANASTRLASLKWDASDTWATVSWSCRVMRTFRNFLIAMDITKSGTRDSRLIAWSTAAASGAVPVTWDKDDATEDAGEEPINQTNGSILDGLSLYDQFMIYKSDSVWGMSYIGGTLTFRIYPVFKDIGILATDCVAEFEGKHFVVTNGDVIVHNGQQWDSVITDRRRDELFASIDPDNYLKTFVVANYAKQEIWICYAQTGSSSPDKAMIWNWRNSTWSDRDLPGTPYIAYGVIDNSGEPKTWDADTGTWDSDTSTWDETNYNPADRKLLMAATNLYQLDSTTQFDGNNFDALVRRESLFFGDEEAIKRINGLWIRSSGSGTLSVRLGYQMNPGEAVTWLAAQTFEAGTDKKIGYRVSGRYISYEIKSTGGADWSIHGVAFDVMPAGKR